MDRVSTTRISDWSFLLSSRGQQRLYTTLYYDKWTRCSAIAERPRCRVRYSFRQKWKTGTGRQYFTDII